LYTGTEHNFINFHQVHSAKRKQQRNFRPKY